MSVHVCPPLSPSRQRCRSSVNHFGIPGLHSRTTETKNYWNRIPGSLENIQEHRKICCSSIHCQHEIKRYLLAKSSAADHWLWIFPDWTNFKEFTCPKRLILWSVYVTSDVPGEVGQLKRDHVTSHWNRENAVLIALSAKTNGLRVYVYPSMKSYSLLTSSTRNSLTYAKVQQPSILSTWVIILKTD